MCGVYKLKIGAFLIFCKIVLLSRNLDFYLIFNMYFYIPDLLKKLGIYFENLLINKNLHELAVDL